MDDDNSSECDSLIIFSDYIVRNYDVAAERSKLWSIQNCIQYFSYIMSALNIPAVLVRADTNFVKTNKSITG